MKPPDMEVLLYNEYMKYREYLINNIAKIHTTSLGYKRLEKNLGIHEDVREYIKGLIVNKDSYIEKEGKNYYIYLRDTVITVNSNNFCVITGKKISKEIVMECDELYLRKMKKTDFKALQAVISDKETMKYYPKPYDEDGVTRWLNWTLDNYERYGFGLWALCLKRNDQMIGDCGITMQPIDGEYRPEVGFHLNKKYWRKGYMKKMAKKVIAWGFENTESEALYSYCNKDNMASYKTAEAAGMHFYKEYESERETERVSIITKDEWLMKEKKDD